MGSASKTRAKMPPSQRAKQFLPFDAVSGLRQALRMKEHEMGLISRKELSQEAQDEINEVLSTLRQGDRISVSFFSQENAEDDSGEIIHAEGILKSFSTITGCITVVTDDAGKDAHGFTEECEVRISDIASLVCMDD